MKKITLLFFCLLSTFLVGQDKITSMVGEYFDSPNWVKNDRAEYAYDANKNLTEQIEYYWNYTNSNWKKSYETNYTYNANNKTLVELSKNYNYETNAIDTQYKTTNTYNAQGQLIEFLNEFWNGAWSIEGKFVLTYTDNRITSAVGYDWDGSNYVFGEDSSNITFTYNANGKVIMFKSDSWDGSNWVDSDRTVYTYDSNNNMIKEDGQIWNGANWTSDYKTEYTYDANGNFATEKESYLDEEGMLEIVPTVTYSFDTTKMLSSFTHPFKDKNGLDYLFTANGYVNKILGKSSENIRYTYNYGEPAASVNNFRLQNLKVFPNPATSMLNIDDSTFNLKSVEVYNVIGKRVLSSAKNQINIEGLVNGVYFVKIESIDGNFATKKVIKN